jgi:hypothetical protein
MRDHKGKDERGKNTCAVRVVASTAYRELDEVNHGKFLPVLRVLLPSLLYEEERCPRIRI